VNYQEARKIVLDPDYISIKGAGLPKHPKDCMPPESQDNWGSAYARELFFEKQLNGYIFHHFGCGPEMGWTLEDRRKQG
jgi:hypothetical protein